MGALDGQKGLYTLYNYKGFYSVILLALVDAHYKFILADVGSNGSCSDVQIFSQCQLKDSIIAGTIRFPDADKLTGDDRTHHI